MASGDVLDVLASSAGDHESIGGRPNVVENVGKWRQHLEDE